MVAVVALAELLQQALHRMLAEPQQALQPQLYLESQMLLVAQAEQAETLETSQLRRVQRVPLQHY